MNAKRVLITGASGFVGANLARQLIADGHDVHLFLREQYKHWRLEDIRNDLAIHTLDLCDAEKVASTVRQIKPEWIFHLAAYGAYESQSDIDKIFKTNLIGTKNLLEACLKEDFASFINTGSSSEYGFKDHAPLETECLVPNSYYAVSKAASSQYCQYSANKFKKHIHTLRLYSVYGPFEEPTRLIPTLIQKGWKNELPVLVDPTIARDLIYIDDVIKAYLSVAYQETQPVDAIYNVGTGIQTSIKEIIDVAVHQLNITAKPQWGTMSNRHWDTSVWVSNSDKIKKVLNWSPQYTFEQGFKKTIQWHQNISHQS